MRDSVHELLGTEAAVAKLGARGITVEEACRLARNRHVTVKNPSDPVRPGTRRLLIGVTDGGRTLTLVIQRTLEPTTWLIITGWSSTAAERNLLRTSR